MLTDKAKQDFEAWLKCSEHGTKYNGSYVSILGLTCPFSQLPLLVQHAYMIEFFDSVGFVLSTKVVFTEEHLFCTDIITPQTACLGLWGDSRKDSVILALEKANLIYNEKYK